MDFYKSRKYVVQYIFITIGLIYIIRLFMLQVLNEDFKAMADENVIREVTDYPARGLIYDRKGKLIVFNEAVYDIMVVPRQVKAMDTTYFCKLTGIDYKTFKEGLIKARKYSPHKPSVLIKQLPLSVYLRFEENAYQFPGFFAQVRTIRKYPDSAAAHIVGYIGEVNEKKITDEPYYQLGDYHGISGIERFYEKELRGEKGVKRVMVDVHNVERGAYADGKYDTASIGGKDLTVGLDIELQKYGEKLMANKRGSIVAIEPRTGEILAFVSSPTFDPNLLTGRERGKNFTALNTDTLKPLFNRPLMAEYPPGSTFKLLNALVALQQGVISPNYGMGCNMGYSAGGIRVKCHDHPDARNLRQAIQHSCNAYFCHVFRMTLDQPKYNDTQKGYNAWRDIIVSFGVGSKLEVDLPHERPGLVPTQAYYDKIHKGWKWRSITVVSLGIGQGELGITPLQMANVMAAIANKGFYYTPHIGKFFKGNTKALQPYKIKHHTKINPRHYNVVIDGLEDVVVAGTGRQAKIPGIVVCGKTGTVENPHGIDHSAFSAFAPKHNPQIAIAVLVENSGWGGSWAAPITGLMIEKYLKGSIDSTNLEKEQKILNADIIPPVNNVRMFKGHYFPTGVPVE